MGNIFDDELDEYAEQQGNTPTVPASVPTAAPQQKSAELAEIEKSLEILNGIKEIQGEMRNTMAELTAMTEKAESLNGKLTDAVQEAKPIWDDLLSSFVKTIEVSDESMEKFNKVMLNYANQIVSKSCNLINEAVTENVTGQFTEVISNKISELDSKMKASEDAHKQVLIDLEKEYRDSITDLKQNHGKLLSQTGEEPSRIFIPKDSFWTVAFVSVMVILCGIVSWFKFWKTNDDAMNYMVAAICAEAVYGIWLAVQWFNNRGEGGNKNEDKTGGFNISLSEALYVMILTLSSTTYIVWGQMDIIGSPKLLLYLLPVAIALNTIWLFTRAIIYGIFKKD